jgi:hypothetical protein
MIPGGHVTEQAEQQGQEPATTTATETSTDPWAAFPQEFNWVRKELEDARKEAAEKRVAARELQDKLAGAKTPDEVEKLTADYNEKISTLDTALARERVARKTGLKEDLVEFLTATTEEGLQAQAEKLAALNPGPDPVIITQPEPRGGQNPGIKPSERDGFAEWEAFKANRR